MEINNIYLESIKKQWLYYKTIAEKAIDQLEDEQLFVSVNDDSNSIAIIMKHISGNMLSRWTDFLTSDGKKLGETEIVNLKILSFQKRKF